ncbi:MAG: hypothetical protein IJX76_03715 [Clostridia bacterium]|nr:hypothetical protein [Clostridia bacterium]
MKKLLSLILATIAALSLASCAELSEVGGTPTGTNPGTTSGTTDDAPGTYTVTARYDYGMHRPGLATMLYDSSTLFFALPEGFDPPVAGDEFTVTYTGQLLIQETYPSTVVITGGEIIGVTAVPAVIQAVRYNVKDKSLTLLEPDGTDMVIGGAIDFPDYYITDGEGHFAELAELTEDTVLYGSIAYTDRMYNGGAVTFSGLYAVNPRGE